MSDLQAVAAEFKKWKGNLTYCRYPEHLWDKAYQLTEHYPLQTIASALDISVQRLEHKFANRRKAITFASVQVAAMPAPVKIAFKQIILDANESQALSIIQILIGEI